MTTWSTDELDRVGGAEELHVTTARPDGSLRPWVPIYRHATHLLHGRVRAAGLERDVDFAPADAAASAVVDQAYRAKYGRYAGSYLDPMLTDQAAAATLRLVPR